jgi:hypothetical protein
LDRSGATEAPAVLEANPTHGNLLGRIEHRVHLGSLVTDFTPVQAGAVYRANDGYLVLDARDVLRNFLPWEALKKALKSRSARIEEPLEEYRLVATAGLAPEPIALSVKLVLLGTPLLYDLLHALDEDFLELFKVKVDFEDSVPQTPDFELFSSTVETAWMWKRSPWTAWTTSSRSIRWRGSHRGRRPRPGARHPLPAGGARAARARRHLHRAGQARRRDVRTLRGLWRRARARPAPGDARHCLRCQARWEKGAG